MCIVEFTGHLLSDRDTTSSTGTGAGVNGNNQWEWEGNVNKTRLNMGLGMGMEMNHWELEGIGLKKIFPLISSRKFVFAHMVYLQGIRVKSVYENHQVKVKVTGAKMVQNTHSRNVKLTPALTPVL